MKKNKISIRGIGKPPYTSYRLTNSVISRVLAVRWSETTTLQPSYFLEISLKFKKGAKNEN